MKTLNELKKTTLASKLAEEDLNEGHGAFADWARENKANRQADREAGRREAHARHQAAIASAAKTKAIRKHHEGLIKNVYKAEHRRSQAEWENAVAAVADHQRMHPHLNLPGHLGEGLVQEISGQVAGNYVYKVIKKNVEKYGTAYGGKAPAGTPEAKRNTGLDRAMKRAIAKAGTEERYKFNEETHPFTYLDKPFSKERLNAILDALTEKPFASLQIFVDTVRAALDFHGFKLPHLDCEMENIGPNQAIAYGDLKHGPGFDINRNVPTVPLEFEYVFQLKYADITGGKEPEEYLYLIANIDDEGEGKYWETYAQVVTPEELADLVDLDDTENVAQDEYLKLQHHENHSGVSPDIEHE